MLVSPSLCLASGGGGGAPVFPDNGMTGLSRSALGAMGVEEYMVHMRTAVWSSFTLLLIAACVAPFSPYPLTLSIVLGGVGVEGDGTAKCSWKFLSAPNHAVPLFHCV